MNDGWITLKINSFDFCDCCCDLWSGQFPTPTPTPVFIARSKQKPQGPVWPVTTSGVFPMLRSTKYLNFCVEREHETSPCLHMLFGTCCKEQLSEVSCRHLGLRERKHRLSSSLGDWSRGRSALSLRLCSFLPTGLVISSFWAWPWLFTDAPTMLSSVIWRLTVRRPTCCFLTSYFWTGIRLAQWIFLSCSRQPIIWPFGGLFFPFEVFVEKQSLWVRQIPIEGV